MNVPASVGAAMSRDPSLIGPLSTVLGLEDLWDILEVFAVDEHNRRIAEANRKRKQ